MGYMVEFAANAAEVDEYATYEDALRGIDRLEAIDVREGQYEDGCYGVRMPGGEFERIYNGKRPTALANLAVSHGRRRCNHQQASEIASNAAKARQSRLTDEARRAIGRRLAEARSHRSPERQKEVNQTISRGMRRNP